VIKRSERRTRGGGAVRGRLAGRAGVGRTGRVGEAMRREWPLVGRDDELQFVVDSLADASARGVVLVGPAGVGKTRLATEAARWAESHGVATAWVSATAASAEIPLGALAPLLGEAISSTTDRVRALSRGCHALVEAGGDQRLVLCVDDAHLLDPLSAALVHQAVMTNAVVLLATVRRGTAVPDEVTALWKDGLIERLEITGLSRLEMDQLTTLVLGGAVHGATLERLWNVTEGNTLFLREVIDAALNSGELAEQAGLWRLSGRIELGQRLVDLVELRLGSLTPAQRSVIEHVALAEPVDVDIIAALATAADLEDAERTGAITAFAEGGRMRLRLAHPLYGEVVRARTPPLRAQGILGGLADALERRGVQSPDEILAMATWRLESRGDCSLDVLLNASRQARNRFDYGLAERIAHAAVTRHGGIAASRARAECLYLAGRFADAEASLASLDDRDATDRERADVAMTRAANLMWGLGDYDAAAARLTAAESAAAGATDVLDDLHALHARVALARARLPDVFSLTGAVLDRAAAGDLARLSAVVGRAPALAMAGRTTDALALLNEYTPLALDHLADYPQGIGTVLISQVTAHWFAGNLEQASKAATDLYDVGMSVHSWDAICAGARSRAWVELAQGRPRTAMRWAHEAAAAIPDGDLNGLACWCQSVLAEAAAVAADPTAGDALAATHAVRHPAIRVYDAQITLADAWSAAMAGEISRAVTGFIDGAAAQRAAGAYAVECHLLHNVVRLDRADAVVDRLIELAAVVDGRWAAAFADHAAALIANDPRELERVAAMLADLGAMLLAAETEIQAARAFREHGLEASRRSAATRSAAWVALCEGARTPTLDMTEAVVPLTRREHEIAALARQGLSSPEIAKRLTLSTRTVEGHLHRLYAKLGVNRREDLDSHQAR